LERVTTGIAGLDSILMGGLVPGSAVLVEGTPGAGKTTLGLQFIHHGATACDEPGLIVSFEEFSRQMIRDAASLGWDLQELIDAGKVRIIPTSPAVFKQEMASAGGAISEMARETGARRILIDSVSHFQRLGDNESEQREIFNSVVNMLRRHGFTSLLTKEVRMREGGSGLDEVSFEQYASDATMRLSNEAVDTTRRARFIEVVKARGQEFVPGKHLFDIGQGGLTVFPNVDYSDAPAGSANVSGRRLERVATGVPGLDEMLEGGLVRGFTTLVAGPAGVGKTAIGLQFLAQGASLGERGVYDSLRIPPAKLRGISESFGIGLPEPEAGLVDIRSWPTMAVNPYRVLEAVIDSVDRDGVRRVVIDSTREIEEAFNDDSRFAQYVNSLVNRFHQKGATCLLLGGPRTASEPAELATTAIAGIVDSTIGLCYVAAQGEIRQGLYILKSRGSGHSTDIRPYSISMGGLRVATRRVTVFD